MEEFQRTQYLYESLVRAQEEAKLTKVQKHPCYSELKRNRDSLSQKAVIQSELLVPYLSIASEIEKPSQNNPLYAFLSSSGCNAPDSVAYPKNSLAVQTSFPENIGIQTENFEWTNSKDKQVSNNPDSKNRNNGTSAHKLKPSDNKSVKNNLSKMSVSVSNQQKQQSRPNRLTSNYKPTTNNNLVNNKTKVSQLLKGKQTSKSQSFNSDSYHNNNDNDFSKSTNGQSKLSSSNSAQTINSCTGTNKFERISSPERILLAFELLHYCRSFLTISGHPKKVISVQDGSSMKSRIPIPISTTHSISSTSMPKHQVSTVNTESPNKTTFLNHENRYGHADLIRTYDVLIPNDANIILPVSHEPGVVENTRKSEGKDLLRNSNTKHERSITRQDTILQQLSEIRKGLQLRQMLCESSTYEDDINY
ncbi:unnamed protein product [Schistosoma margrebowiei]|uniref:Uncharacterized protein n=1 Tax=Schistosoma margrebowiei TaxID=48269 RepID=A0A183LMV4_9TREM|nr:unnamed protein product [Schistosoma margrebowiei]